MLWLCDLSHPDALDDFRPSAWLTKHGIQFQLTNDFSEVTETDTLIITGGNYFLLERTDLIKDVMRIPARTKCLGICLGSFALASIFQTALPKFERDKGIRLETIKHRQSGLFSNVPNPCKVVMCNREYIDCRNLDPAMVLDTVTDDGEAVTWHGIQRPIFGISFHPENPSTESGDLIFKNFLSL